MRLGRIGKSFLVSLAALALMAISFASHAQVLGTASLNVERRGHTATQLKDGKILVAGGENTGGVVSQAEVFDP
ncbi:MAG TPA: kelch repeat-containing protein, partial [Candidatus Binatia bacterium]